ncbi:hypothetical protein ASZ90_019407 [hydrocarbon metagenome]|uniref:Uncharacterized protein n=1 Tax=hydrocarbon metagenome TaxID=938273 RepID=A0A0W8E3K8_9ZZZZ
MATLMIWKLDAFHKITIDEFSDRDVELIDNRMDEEEK